MGSFTTVELFARYFNWIEKPHKIENSANYHLFKDGIKPMWEDPANANGGRWIVTLSNKNGELLDRCWMELAYALVGEQLDAGDDICGAVLSRRTKADRLAVWVRDKDNVEAINGIGKRLIKILDIAKERISLEFQVGIDLGLCTNVLQGGVRKVTADTRSTGPPKTYISLETIRKELAQEATMAESNMPQTTSVEGSTPSLVVDSTSATPVSVTDSSPSTPSGADKDKGEKNMAANGTSDEEKHMSMGKSGLLISVNGNEDFAEKP
ncbi:hypothetical protein BG011_008003 [Mortierella polycephala]|uniref:Eukaryotic translation initiation factor 4E n=1 Tax=Mortierella polycephala TaxID=41804 RepID=A0A9P6TY09_9FUNG|nr:hypothetical protein BG011_008003 [Mortierella polycephala]